MKPTSYLSEALLGCFLLLPFAVLILFTPTQELYCDGSFINVYGGCYGNLRWRDGGVVLEVIVRWFMSQDWLGSLINLGKILFLVIALGLAAVGFLLIIGVRMNGEWQDGEKTANEIQEATDEESEQERHAKALELALRK